MTTKLFKRWIDDLPTELQQDDIVLSDSEEDTLHTIDIIEFCNRYAMPFSKIRKGFIFGIDGVCRIVTKDPQYIVPESKYEKPYWFLECGYVNPYDWCLQNDLPCWFEGVTDRAWEGWDNEVAKLGLEKPLERIEFPMKSCSCKEETE